MKKLTLLAAACFLAVITTLAGTDPKWKQNFANEINWMKVTDAGALVVATDDGLFGVNADDGKILWTNDKLKKLIVETYESMAGTPYFIIAPDAKPTKAKTGFAAAFAFGGPKPAIIIINGTDGTVVCDTKEQLGFKMLTGQYRLPELNTVIFEGVSAATKKMVAIYYDFNTNTKVWEKESILTNKCGSFVPPIVVDENTLLWTSSCGYSIIDIKTGNVKYSTEIKFKDPAAPKIVFNEDRSVVYFINKKFGNAYKISDGTALWKTPIDMDDPATHVFTDSRGIYIAVPKYINLYDYKTGEAKWGKDGIKLYDPLMNYAFTDKGLGIQMVDKDDYSLNLLDYETGKPLVKKAFKLKDAAVDVRMVPKGLLYRTAKELNILDAETGKPSFEKSIKFKDDVITVDKGDKTYIFCGKNFYVFDNQACTYNSQEIDTKFEDKEKPKTIEIRNNNLLLKADQNLTMFDTQGKVIFHAFYKAPGLSMAAKIAQGALMVASAAASAGMAASSGMEQGANGGYATSHSETMYKGSQGFAGAASHHAKEMNKRFNATKEADGFVTMLTKLDDGVGVVKVNKDNGNKENEVIFKEKEPIYEIDELGAILYFKSKKTELSGFKF
jgi:outer membrane protein assembly factor BamB